MAKKKSSPSINSPLTRAICGATKECLPAFKYLRTTGKSKPVVWFERKRSKDTPQLCNLLDFEKTKTRVQAEIHVVFEGNGVRGKKQDFLLEREPIGEPLKARDESQVADWIARQAPSIRQLATRLSAPYEKNYGELSTLFSDLISFYLQWFDCQGADFSARDSENVWSDDPTPAYDSFLAHLAERQVLPQSGSWHEKHLMHFWEYFRPEQQFSFSKIVRQAMAEAMPSFQYEKTTTDGKGPEVWFKGPTNQKPPEICPLLSFLKGPYGANDFLVRMSVVVSRTCLDGPAQEDFVQTGVFGGGRDGTKPVQYKTSDDVKNWIANNAPAMERRFHGCNSEVY